MRLRPTHNDIGGLILRDFSSTARVVSKNQVFGRLVNDRLAAAEALEFRRPLKGGVGVERAYQTVRALVPPSIEDRSMSRDIEVIAAALREGKFDSETEKL